MQDIILYDELAQFTIMPKHARLELCPSQSLNVFITIYLLPHALSLSAKNIPL